MIINLLKLVVAIDRFTNQILLIVVDDFDVCGGVLIYSESGEFLRPFYHDDIVLTSDSSMAIHKDNVYIITWQTYFQHFKIADSISLICSKDDKSFGAREYSGSREFDISKEGDLFVTDCRNNRVQILDGNLKYKRHISHHSMLKPCDVKLTSDEVYVLGDSPEQSTNCFHIFTLMGEKIQSTFLNGIPNGVRCREFCVDNHGNIIITDNATHQIKFFTKEGNLFETMDTFSGTLSECEHPFGVAWIGKQKLVVISGDFWHSLEMYYFI